MSATPRSYRPLLAVMFPALFLSLACAGGNPSPAPGPSEQETAAAAAEYAAAEAEIAGTLVTAGEQLASRDLDAAASSIKSAQRTLDPFRSKLGEVAVQAPSERINSLHKEHARVTAVQQAIIVASEVVADKEKCGGIEPVSTAWSGLQQVAKSDPERSAAAVLAKKLDKCRIGIQRDLTKLTADLMVMQRESMPSKMDRVFLENGMDVRITLKGKAKDEIRFTWVLMSRVTIHQLTGGGSMSPGAFLRNLQDVGFKKVVFSDGYSESTSYALEPQSVGEASAESLANVGLGAALVLAE